MIIIKTGELTGFEKTDTDKVFFEYNLAFKKSKYLIEEVYRLSRSGKKVKTL